MVNKSIIVNWILNLMLVYEGDCDESSNIPYQRFAY